MGNDNQTDPAQIARHVQQSLPADGLFAGHQWRVATRPFPLDKKTVKQLEKLGRMLLKFYQATNMIYRWSAEGRLPRRRDLPTHAPLWRNGGGSGLAPASRKSLSISSGSSTRARA